MTFFGKETNLHSVWDTELVESQNLSYTEFVEFIDTQNPQTISKLLASEPKDWVLESFDLARTIYRQEDTELSYSYLYENMPVVKQRLLAGGIRLAGLLNHIFDKSAPVLVSK